MSTMPPPPPPRQPSPSQTQGGSGKTHRWTVDETEMLLDCLRDNSDYQLMLIPGRVTKEQEKRCKMSKATIRRLVFRHVFGPDQPVAENRIKTKLANLNQKYQQERAKLGETGSGLLFSEVQEGTSMYDTRTQLQGRCPWFERWHEMVNDRQVEPVDVYTVGTWDDDEGSTDTTYRTEEDGREESEEATSTVTDSQIDSEGQHGRGVPSMDSISAQAEADPMSVLVHEPSTTSHLQTSPRSTEDEEDNHDEELQPNPPDTPTATQDGSSPRKRARQTQTEKRDSIAMAIAEAREGARVRREEERTKREELRNARMRERLEWEREKMEREETMRRVEVERGERQQQQQHHQMVNMMLQVVRALRHDDNLPVLSRRDDNVGHLSPSMSSRQDNDCPPSISDDIARHQPN